MPGMSRKKGARKKPKLLTLKVVEPSYRKECKDEVLPGSGSFDKKKMNEVGLGLPKDQGGPRFNRFGFTPKTCCFLMFDFPHIWILGHAETVPRHISRFQC